MKAYNEIKEKLEKIFNELRIKYTELDLKDDDFNYLISINIGGRFKAMNTIAGCLYLSLNNNQVCLLVANIYKFAEDENLIPFYKILNDINAIGHGVFAITSDKKQIIYRNTEFCGEKFSDLSAEAIKQQIDCFVCELGRLFDAIKEEKND